MKTNVLFVLILFPLYLALHNPVHSQGFNAVSMSDEFSVIAVGDSGKIFMSFDSGISWKSLSVPPVNFNSISSKSIYSYLTTFENNVYRISSKGVGPVSIFSINGNYHFNSVDFITDSTGFVCGENGAVFKTSNAGVNWIMKNSGLTGFDLNSISFKDMNNGVVCADEGYIFITSDGGNSWSAATKNPLTNYNLLKIKYFDNGIAAAGGYGALIIKKNNSSDWNSINTRISSDIRGISGSNINDVHVCGGGGFIRNNKNDNSGFTNFEPNPMMANLVDLYISGSNTGFAVSSLNKAIIRTTNGGESWEFTEGVYATYIWEKKADDVSSFGNIGNTLCRHPNDRNTFFCGQDNRVFVSRDNGETWTDIAGVPGEQMQSFYVSPLDTNIWMCAINGVTDKIMRSTDYGQNWTTSASGIFSFFGQPLELDQNDPSVYYYAPDGGGFYKSSDNGITFDIISNYPFLSPCDIIVMWDSSEVIFVGDGPTNSQGAKIFRSSNGGYNWHIVFDDNGLEIPSMCNSVFEQDIVYAANLSEFLKSSDYGISFNSLSKIGEINWATAVCEEDPTLLINGAFVGASYFSLDKGISWNFANASPTFAGYGLLAPTKNTLLYYTSQGIYKLKVTFNGVVSIDENITSYNIPKDFTLHQNYPNPFNPNTKIRFDLPSAGDFSLKIYDISGKEINTLTDGFKSAGSYEVNFNAGELTSGIYFYKLSSNKFSITKKMLLVK